MKQSSKTSPKVGNEDLFERTDEGIYKDAGHTKNSSDDLCSLEVFLGYPVRCLAQAVVHAQILDASTHCSRGIQGSCHGLLRIPRAYRSSSYDAGGGHSRA